MVLPALERALFGPDGDGDQKKRMEIALHDPSIKSLHATVLESFPNVKDHDNVEAEFAMRMVEKVYQTPEDLRTRSCSLQMVVDGRDAF